MSKPAILFSPRYSGVIARSRAYVRMTPGAVLMTRRQYSDVLRRCGAAAGDYLIAEYPDGRALDIVDFRRAR